MATGLRNLSRKSYEMVKELVETSDVIMAGQDVPVPKEPGEASEVVAVVPPAKRQKDSGAGVETDKDKDKGKGQGKGAKADFAGVVQDLAKLVIVHDEQIQSVEGILLTTWLTEESFVPSVKASEQGRFYHAQVKAAQAAASKSSSAAGRTVAETSLKLGPPHVYVGTTFVKELAKLSITDEGALQKKQEIGELVSALDLASPDEVAANFIPYFRVTRCFDERYKVRFKTVWPAHTELINWYMAKSEGTNRKHGKAPKGKMVRNVEKWLGRQK